MTWFKKIPWFPQIHKRMQAVIYDTGMMVRYFVVIAVILPVFMISVVRNYTGIEPWEYLCVAGAHFVSSILPQIIFKNMNNARFVLWGLFSDRFITACLALFGSQKAAFLWIFFVFLCMQEPLSNTPSVYSCLQIFIAPLTAWAVFIATGLRGFSVDELAMILTVSSITAMLWFYMAGSTKTYRLADRELEESRAQAELERRRSELSRDIHDAIAAIFTRILSVQKDENNETSALTREGLSQLRDIITALQAENTSLGFLSSWLNHYAQHYFENTGIKTHFSAKCESQEARLDPVRIIHAMRIFQELCQNALKHSGASEISALFTESAGQATLVFADNGKGLPANTAANQGSGLKNMLARTEELGGKLEQVDNQAPGTMMRLEFAV
ncbi:MAG: hypothetical protein KF713_00300 [Turneriella sp.]|nr:hypothetical protein [Turneriella sp.]